MIVSILIIISCYILWNILASFEGFVRAHYEDYLYFIDRKHKNLHPFYFIIRGLILIPFCVIVFYESDIINAVIFLISCASSYSFFFNGFLYMQRNNLAPEIYKKRFTANKEKGEDKNSAILEMSFRIRSVYFLVSACFIVGIILVISNQ